MKRTVLLIALFLFCQAVDSLSAGPVRPSSRGVPPALESWQQWTLHGQTEQNCPPHFNDPSMRRCWWPSHLTLDVGDQGGLFDQQVTVYAPAWVSLPGDEPHWPESVTNGNDAVPVVGRDGRPGIWLEPGEYRIQGAFVWDRLPDVIQIPASTGILLLKVDGQDVAEPDLDSTGRLRFQGSGRAAGREDTLTATLFRLVEDDVPMRVVTRTLLQVSGRAREIRLPVRLPEAAVVMKIDSPLPARLDGNGDLLVQAKPGRWDIRLTERLTSPAKTLSAGNGPYGEEIWSFKAFNHLRMVKVAGAPSIEPSRTQMPDEWKGFPAFLLNPGTALTFDHVRRGDPDPAPDQLALERTWWLDFDGSGFTVHDRIRGTLSRTWHLALGAPMELGRVAVDGVDQLITLQGEDPSSAGVQLRRGRLSLVADSRLPRASSTLPAIGWDHDFQQVHGRLNLPPGWTLFSAAGVDTPPGAWLQKWTLLDFFLVLIIAISTYKLRDRRSAALIMATLILIFHEPGAPRQVWLHLLAAGALLKYLPDGWFKWLVRLWGSAAVLALVIIALPFMVQQVRNAIYPQLYRGGTGIDHRIDSFDSDRSIQEKRAAAPEPALMSDQMRQTVDAIQQSATLRKPRLLTDPNALIQTGPGLPAWQWQSVALRWNGPVDRNHRIRLWLLSPIQNMGLGLIRVVLLLFAIEALLDARHWRRHIPSSFMAGTITIVLLAAFLAPVPPLHAEPADDAFPPQPLLDELKRRLLEPAPCFPHCADISRLELAATPDQLRLILMAHAQVDTAMPLPGTLDGWRPNQLQLDNEPVKSLSRDDRGNLWMVVPRGVHRIKMTGPTGDANEIRIAFPIVPHVGTYAGVGWQARGFRPDNSMESSIAMTRVQKEAGSKPETSKSDIPAFFHLTRTLHLGIQWEVVTRIQRLTEPGEPAILSVPLLDNASLTTAGIQVVDGMAQVSLGADETEVRFSSTIPISPSIQLTAPLNTPWAETWILDATTMWRCSFSGLSVVHHQDDAQNWQPQWRPWPGEQVSITVTRPKAVPGRTVTIDSAQLELTPGQRFSRTTLTLDFRSSRGGQHQIELPDMANLQTVTINGTTLPIRQDGRLVSIPLEPGPQTVSLQWLELSPSMTLIKAPRVVVGDAAVNAAVIVNMPDHRWIIFAGGPRLGPAVLFWSYVIVVLVVAAGLGKTEITPLRTRHWVLLGLGLTQVPPAIAVLVVGWLLALGCRCRKDMPAKPTVFNLIQILLAILTLAALTGLYFAVERGLLGIPDMQIAGNGSTRFQLNWMQDRIGGTLPRPWVVSLPQWIYHALMLFWSLWLAFSLVVWLRWGWGCFTKTHLWKTIVWRRKSKKSGSQGAPSVPAKASSSPTD